MTTAAEFWAYVQPSGLTAEAELVAFWQAMLDCRCGQHQGGGMAAGVRTPRSRTDDSEDDLLRLLHIEDESFILAISSLIASGRLH